MPVRLRITLLFTLAVFIILGLVAIATLYFSATTRRHAIETRLINRAITTERLLRQSETFDREMIRKIDSSTTMALKRKSVQAYKLVGRKIYNYSEVPGDTVQMPIEQLESVREKGQVFFTAGEKEVVAYHDPSSFEGLVIVCAAVDVDGKANLRQLSSILLIGFCGGLIAAFGGGYFFSGRLLRPIREITSEVNDISAYNLTRRIETGDTNDEWNRLSTTLNNLLDRLQESFEQQRRFISNASHEMSTPLTLISSQLEVTLQRARTEEEYRHMLLVILRDVQNMNNLVQMLLKFATASGNMGGLTIEQLRIDEILMRLPRDIQKQDAQHSVTLRFGKLPENENELLVFGNDELLSMAIKNIVTNACKYSPDHHAVVTLERSKAGFNIHVEDKGVGISEADIKHIFDPFYRVQETRSVHGFGLGLALASQVIKLHKGQLSVHSAAGAGSVFTIFLPTVTHT